MKKLMMTGSCMVMLLICTTVAYPQYYLAGQHNAGSYYVDIDPDTTLVGPYYHTGNPPPAVFTADIDGDGVGDFNIVSIGFWANGGGNYAITVTGLDSSSQVAFGYSDTCRVPGGTYYFVENVARLFRRNDTLNTGNVWAKSMLLTYVNWSANGWSCNRNTFTPDTLDSYIGVRKIRQADTIYGWIKVTKVAGLAFTVQEYGSSQENTGVRELPDGLRIYPNPAKEKVFIESDFSGYDLNVYNQYGIEIFTLKNLQKKTEVRLDGRNAGGCLFKLTHGLTVVVKKIILLTD